MLANRVRMVSNSKNKDDLSGSPGNPMLIAGTMQEGFFGEVPASELITGDNLANQVGLDAGVIHNSNEGWLKFGWKGKVQFIAKKSFRTSIAWQRLFQTGIVYGDSGDKMVTINGLTYKVRLMRAFNPSNNPRTSVSTEAGAINHYSEWNRLMCQIHEEAINGSWRYPNNIESDIGILEHGFGSGINGMYTNSDLLVVDGNGARTLCQEMGTSSERRIIRGVFGVSGTSATPEINSVYSTYGWRPVLELV